MEKDKKILSDSPVYVYISKISPTEKITAVYPLLREREIRACKNEKVQREKYFVWKLLGYAFKRSFGLEIQTLRFKKSVNGKWSCNKAYFSLSHSHDVAAVALADTAVGVDIELIEPLRIVGAVKRILNEEEWSTYSVLDEEEKTEYCIRKWTEKESLFKRQGDGVVFATEPNGFSGKTRTEIIEIAGRKYALSVAAENVEDVHIFVLDK